MKKGILILTILALSIFLTKVDALSLDGIQTGPVQVDTSSHQLHLTETTTTDWWPFTTNFTNTDNDYLIFNYSGMYNSENYTDWNTQYWNIQRNNVQINVTLVSTNGANNKTCEFQNNYIVCPIIHGATYTGIWTTLWVYDRGGENNFLSIGYEISEYPQKYKTNTNAIIDNQNQNTNTIMGELNQTQEYNQTVDTNQIGANETLQAGQLEDQLINATDFNGSLLDGITINPNASSFIWTIVDGLRNMNIAIVTLFTSIMGMGIIKLVLNR